jgi:hypothetical protein
MAQITYVKREANTIVEVNVVKWVAHTMVEINVREAGGPNYGSDKLTA